jgi:uncharacterized SAM-binding protein YcdF (DUF218 family)
VRGTEIDVIYVHKILPVLLLPTGITLMLVVAGLALRRRALCWIGIAVLWVASTPLVGDAVMRAAEGWQIRQPISAAPQSQAIVVLSGGRSQPPGDTSVSEWGDADRFYGGVELYKAKKAPLLIFTGGWAPWRPNARPEGDILIPYAADLGVPRDRMLTTARVASTQEEARAVADLLAERFGTTPAPQILLVTSAFQMRRAVMLFARAGVSVVPFGVDFKVSADETFTVLKLLPSAGSLGKTETALREFYGLLFYGLFSRFL